MALSSIDLELEELFRDPKRADAFFRSIAQDEIAAQIRSLRKARDMTQASFAERADMKQSAVSRIEQAEYAAWNLTTLFRVAEALRARWKITLQPIEDAVSELLDAKSATDASESHAAKAAAAQQALASSSSELQKVPNVRSDGGVVIQ